MSLATAKNATAGPSKPKSQAVKTVAVDSGKTIRAQSKKDKAKSNVNNAGQEQVDRAGMSKEVVKAVLASPLTVSWPNIPRHLQNATLHALKELIPSNIADYHVSRARCHQREKRSRRRILRKSDNAEKSNIVDSTENLEASEGDKDTEEHSEVGKKRTSGPSPPEPATKRSRLEVDTAREIDRPLKPEILSHMVLGINEVLKTLESQISSLRMRLMIMGDALNGKITSTLIKSNQKSHLLPTAPRSPSSSPEPEEVKKSETNSQNDIKILEYIIVPLLSINPQSLVSPIPQYCATYNALVYQHQHLSKICRTRLKSSEVEDVIGEAMEEVRVVPLGAVEKEITELVGLRRVACLGIRGSHPSVSLIRNLLPKSVLHPPRHSITLPIPTSSLNIHNSNSNNIATTQKSKPLIPGVHYADLHIKGIKTKIPVDNAARKAKRLEEVRKKRVEAKLKKKEANEKAKKR
ncbi:uncharacterized protein I206_100959 [Kwoniella pini CBS 10737]|uniref:Uncharacterized protein n=1 Tax=Kwoniella pini CBS 10737 TaxID=1296096 RepID=A0A1B9IC22_9TREE|nr:uncharacterized protein I206_00367 [Kwoniella pini CBS 10737]OCF53066.1 hypothetical protein I206_00367 [Kwoniella pini CBS 10737]